MGLSWGEVQPAAKDRTVWRNIVIVALCAVCLLLKLSTRIKL